MSDAEVWLVRHGETEWSRDHKHTSTTDLPLTEVGEGVARGLSERLGDVGFDLVLASPRQRASRSAELAGFSEAEVEENLVEWGYGDYEGVTTVEIRETVPGWSVWTHPTPGGETGDEVGARLDRVVSRCRAAGGRTLVFGHGHALRVLGARWIGLPPESGALLALSTASLSILGWERGRQVIQLWNDLSHLAGAAAGH